ncbi:YciI family protein [Jiangella asiatica]|uniref:YCII-related domain-containing protein n=1 Tax=Jiangella asiatica TaxID=2530372 RepID=A0A4R5CNK8_9ACTN|nr:YciI family protein [Jiangella asiatica]TDE01999.1 hypothetical protein E1269_22405 [Jiangella asiatica]
MPHYAILIFDPANDTEPADTQAAAAHDRHADDLASSGRMLAAFALRPGAQARAVRRDGVTDGPFLETKEVVAGIYVLEAPDLDAAVEIARHNPAVQQGGGVEVREVEDGTLPG